MASNNLTPGNGKADISITDGTNTVGMQYLEKTALVEGRGTAFAGNTNSGGTTYQDATPFKRKVYDNWIGGLGQAKENTTFGGTGAGGDPTKFLDAEAHTRKTGFMFPGFARNLVYNTVSAAVKTPIADGLDPLGGDEQEMPRGVMPVPLPVNFNYQNATFTSTASGATVSNVRVLIQVKDFPSSGYGVFAELYNTANTAMLARYIYVINATDTNQYTGWKWVTCPIISGGGVLAASTLYNLRFTTSGPQQGMVTLGCYIGASNTILPYFQLMTSATPYKYWAAPPAKFEQLLNGTTYVNAAITTGALFNTAATGTAGTAGTSPERTITGTYLSSIVFNNKLYVSSTGPTGTAAWDAAAAATNAAPTNAFDSNASMISPVEWNGMMYFVGGATKLNIYKWDGTFPVTGANLTQIVNGGLIGQSGTFINGLFIMGGWLYAVKPEGIYQIFRDPSKIDTTEVPQVNKVFAFPINHQDNGKWWVIHQNMLFVNCRDTVWQLAFGGQNGTQAQEIKPDFPRYRLSYYHYVNGITSDGRQVYASWNNLGVYSYVGAAWHKEFDFYEQVAVEGQSSGLRWLPNPTSAPDYLFCGDGRTIVQMPCPNANGPYTRQIYANSLNKCGWLISSAWDGDLAEIVKYIQSAVLRALPNGHSYKLVASIWDSTGSVSAATVLEKTWQQGLLKDNWTTSSISADYVSAVATTKLNPVGGAPLANTLAPACWGPADLNNIYSSSEKLATSTSNTAVTPAVTDMLTTPTKVVSTNFILYFWNPTLGLASTSYQEVMSVDSFSIKYQPIQDYLPIYQVTIDVDSMIVEQTEAVTNANVNDCVTQVRAWAGRHSPVRASFYTSEGIKTVNVFVQEARFEYDPIAGGTGIEPLPKRIFLTLIGVDPEYVGS